MNKHDPITLARIRKLAFLTLQDPVFRLLTTPLNTTEFFNTTTTTTPLSFTCQGDHPSFDWNRLEAELVLFWIRMWDTWGLVPWNFHLFLQTDGHVVITDMEQFGFVHWDDSTGKRTKFWITMPCIVSTQFFFTLSSFPNSFYERVKGIEGVSPVFSLENP